MLQVKLAAVYCSMTLICLIMSTLLVRAALGLVTWVVLGRSLWLFPYLLSEVCCSQPPSPDNTGSVCMSCSPKPQLEQFDVHDRVAAAPAMQPCRWGQGMHVACAVCCHTATGCAEGG